MRHPTPRSGGYGTDDAPITVTTYGEGAKALIGGKTLADVFTERVDQGWVVDEGVAPATPSIDVEVETLTAGESSKLSLAGFTPGQEVTLELRPGAVNVGKVITDAQGNADVTVTMTANTAAGDYTIVATERTEDRVGSSKRQSRNSDSTTHHSTTHHAVPG